jgi:hypothetical protein
MRLAPADRVISACGKCPMCTDQVKECVSGKEKRVLRNNPNMEDHFDMEVMGGSMAGAERPCPIWTVSKNISEDEREEQLKKSKMVEMVEDWSEEKAVKIFDFGYGDVCYTCRAGMAETHGKDCAHTGVFGPPEIVGVPHQTNPASLPQSPDMIVKERHDIL